MKKTWGLQNSRSRMIALFIVDILSVILDSYLAIILRFKLDNIWVPAEYMYSVESYMVINVITTVVIFLVLNLYNRVWSYASINEMLAILGATMLSTVFQAFGFSLLYLQVPRSYYFFYFILLSITTIITRFSYRILHTMENGLKKSTRHSRNTIVIGAGEAGNMIIKELKSSKYLNQKVVCVIDDNPSKKGKYIHGIRIVGGRDKIQEAAKKYDAEEIILAIPSAGTKNTRDILRICNLTDCKLKILPGMYQLINDDVGVSNLREVSIEDLLGRDTIEIDMESVGQYVRNKRVLVTGGGGSIGSEICRQIMRFKPKLLIIFEIYENCAYELMYDLRQRYGKDCPVITLIGSIRDKHRLDEVFDLYHPEVVFHAAAHKHVPLMELSPAEAIKNNVFGTRNLLESASAHGVERLVQLSTDKAVNPTNVMGATKRITEMLIQRYGEKTNMKCMAVRFGNVLGSHGSVIPLMESQIRKGGPVTVTHPDITRYFMTIPEAAQLVLQAGGIAKSGSIFVLDMGEPVRIMDLAKKLIRAYGYEPNVDMPIKIIGLRPGEKLYEELLMDSERDKMTRTAHKKIFVANVDKIDDAQYDHMMQVLQTVEDKNDERAVEAIAEIVPTYHPDEKNRPDNKAELLQKNENQAAG